MITAVVMSESCKFQLSVQFLTPIFIYWLLLIWRRRYPKNYQKSDKLPQNYKSSKSAWLLRSSAAGWDVSL